MEYLVFPTYAIWFCGSGSSASQHFHMSPATSSCIKAVCLAQVCSPAESWQQPSWREEGMRGQPAIELQPFLRFFWLQIRTVCLRWPLGEYNFLTSEIGKYHLFKFRCKDRADDEAEQKWPRPDSLRVASAICYVLVCGPLSLVKQNVAAILLADTILFTPLPTVQPARVGTCIWMITTPHESVENIYTVLSLFNARILIIHSTYSWPLPVDRLKVCAKLCLCLSHSSFSHPMITRHT